MPGVSVRNDQRLAARLPLDRRTGKLDLRDGPFLLRLAPQREGDRASTQRLAFALAGQDVLEFDVAQQRLPFGDEIVDRLVAVANVRLDDHLGDGVFRLLDLGFLGLGDGQRDLALLLLGFLLRFRIFRDDRGGRLYRRIGDGIDHRDLGLLVGIPGRRAPREYQCQDQS